jgi:hypothetical protein
MVAIFKNANPEAIPSRNRKDLWLPPEMTRTPAWRRNRGRRLAAVKEAANLSWDVGHVTNH